MKVKLHIYAGHNKTINTYYIAFKEHPSESFLKVNGYRFIQTIEIEDNEQS